MTQSETTSAAGGGETGLRKALNDAAFSIDGIGGAATPTPKLLRILADHLDGIRRIENVPGYARSLRGRADFLDEAALAARAALAAPTAKGGTDLRHKFDEYDITQDMIQAGRYAANLNDGTLARIYLAMRAAEIAVSPPPPAGAAGGGSGDLGALRAGATADPAPNAAASHATNFRTLSVGAPTPDLGAQGEQRIRYLESVLGDIANARASNAASGFPQGLRPDPAAWMEQRAASALYEAPAAPRPGSGVSVEEIDKLYDEVSDAMYAADILYAYSSQRSLKRLRDLALFAQAPHDGGWQPIETAPKDGQLIAVGGGCAFWDVERECWCSAVGHCHGRPIQWSITHWKSVNPSTLPTPPSGVEAIRQDNTIGSL